MKNNKTYFDKNDLASMTRESRVEAIKISEDVYSLLQSIKFDEAEKQASYLIQEISKLNTLYGLAKTLEY